MDHKFLKSGVSGRYLSPEVTVTEIAVESGFAQSPGTIPSAPGVPGLDLGEGLIF